MKKKRLNNTTTKHTEVTMGNKKTAVEWFIRELEKQGVRYFTLSEKALKMEKKQIIDAWIATDNELQRISAEQYYNETYGGNK